MVEDKDDKTEGEKKAAPEKAEESIAESEVIPADLIKGLPPETQKQIRQITAVMRQYSGPSLHPLSGKVTPEHVTKIIDNAARDDERRFQEGKDIRKTGLIIFFAILIPVVGLLIFFSLINRVDIVIPLVSALVAFGGGYGIGKSRQ